MSKKLKYISFIQTVGMILIVLSHSVSQYAEYPMFTGKTVQIIQRIGLTAFMWCSGYLLLYTNSIEKHGYKTYMMKRLVRLMVPFFTIQILMLIPKMMIARLQGISLQVNIIHSFLYPREGILPHLWFLPTLMILCVTAPIYIKAVSKKKGAIALMIGALFLTLIPDIVNILCINDVKNYLVWFVLGIIMARYFDSEKMEQKFKHWYMVILIPAYIGLFVLIGYAPLKWLFCSLCSLAFLLFIGFTCTDYTTGGYMTKYTFPIYILSLPVQNIIEVIYGRIGQTWYVASVLMFSMGIMIPIGVSVVIEMIEKQRKGKYISHCIGM